MALAGIFQSARLARDIARKGMCDAEALETTTNSLFSFDAESTEEALGGLVNLRQGLRTFIIQLEGGGERDIEIAQYFVSINHMAGVIQKTSGLMDKLHASLLPISTRVEEFNLTSNTLYTQIAGVYQDHISNLSPPIMVKGEPLHLQNPDNASRIRSALLGGIRAAILWDQVGGRKTQLLFQRKKQVTLARQLLDQVSL